ncbi:MAG: PLP-dependent aspartate aminotransferase family protein [Chloroflexota bacterium]|nr:PLP-dependent aspartate aminotransferase family protein [Chloroflexota bacterium]
MPDQPSFETQCVHAGDAVGATNGPISPPLVLSSVFETPTLEMAGRAIRGEPGAYIYSRDANPTVVMLERALAALEGAEAAVATGSGMGAISTLFVALLSAGDHVVMARELYGATVLLLSQYLSRFGVWATAADATNLVAVEAAIQPNTKLIFVETVSNPLMRLADLPSIAEMAHRRGVLLAVDATFTTPVLSRPLAQGADLVMHSATKYLSGHSDVTAGIVAGNEPLIRKVGAARKFFGPTCSPLDAWLTLRGLKTLALRVERHTANAQQLAELLEQHPRVSRVCYAGLAASPQRELAACLLPRGAGGMLSFEIDGGRTAVDRFIAALRIARFAASLGDVSTTISHPAVTSHGCLSIDERGALGISDGLIRVSVGIESIDDLCADFERGLDAV